MLKNASRNVFRRAGSLALACALLFCALAIPAQAAETFDVGVIGVTLNEDDKVVTTLYCQDDTKPEEVKAIAYYVDGERVAVEEAQLDWNNGDRAQITSDETVAREGNLTVVIDVEGDDNISNNNRTVVLSDDMYAPPDLSEGDEDDIDPPEETEETDPPQETEGGSSGGETTPTNVQSVSASYTSTETTVTLSWSPTGSGSAPTGYQIVWNNGETTNVGTATSYTFSGLTAGTTYSYTIIANGSGTSSQTSGTAATQAAQTVNPVTNLSGSADASTFKVTLTWTAPTSGASPTGYEITRTGGGDTQVFSSSGSPFLDSRTSAGTTYTYSVVTVSGSLKSTAVTVEVKVPEAETGDADAQPVENLTVFCAPANFVTLTWEAPASGDTPTGYAIYNGDRQVATVGADTLTYKVTGLSASTSYTFKVVTLVNGVESAAKTVSTTTSAASDDNGKADLIVTDIRFDPVSPSVGDDVVFTAVVKNQGTKATPEGTIVGVRFGINSVEGSPFTWCDNYTSSVAPGESVLLTVNGGSQGASWTPGTAGTYSIHAWVDDQNRITESNTDNNDDYSKSVTVAEEGALTVPAGDSGNATVYVASSVGSGLTQSSGIAVTVNNKTSPVFNANVNNSRYWDTLIIETTPVTIFELSKENTSAIVRVALSKDMNSVIVRPLSDGIKPVIKEENGQRYAEFTITKWGSYTVEFNGSTSKALHLFVNPPYTEYSQNPSAYGFSGYTYIGLGSVSGKSYFDGNNGVYGSGVILVNGGQPSTTVNGGARLVGVTFLNPSSGPSWNMQIYGSQDDIEFNYFHMITCGRNSDGITIQSSHNVRILNSYLRAWDDCVVLKIYTPDDTYNVTVDNCVFWSDLAQAMEIGAETNKASGGYNSDPEIYNVVFSNNDVIHAFHKPALSIHNMDNAKVHNVTYENITIEDASMGNNARTNEDGWPILIDLTNTRGGELDGTADSWTSQWDSYGSIYDITYKNIQVLSWANQNTVFGTANNVLPGIRAVNSARVSGGGGSIYNINIQGLHYLQTDGSVLSINSVSDLGKTFSPNDVKGTTTFNPDGNFKFTTVTNPDIRKPSDYTYVYGS